MPSQGDKSTRRPAGTLVGGRTTRLVGGAVRLRPPRGFVGRAQVEGGSEGTRAFDVGEAPVVPPGLMGDTSLFQPVTLPGTRAFAAGPAAIELDASRAARRQVTPDSPLTVTLDTSSTRSFADLGAGLLAVLHDGSAFFPVGRSDSPDQVQVEWLPDPPASDPEVGTSTVGRIAKLYLYQVMGRPEPTLGLYHARFMSSGSASGPDESGERVVTLPEGEVRYRAVAPDELGPGQRIALLVHGFGSSTDGMLAELATVFSKYGVHYDHVLTFDYETVRSGVRDAGTQLADALRDLGFGPQDGHYLDVFAHSMGTLVTRYMVEIAGGRRFVDRVFLAGPPNYGTGLANLKGALLWLVTLGLNLTGSSLPAMIAGWALKLFDKTTVSLDDLTPSSTIVHDLRNTARTGEVLYHALAGTNELAGPTPGGWAWLARQVMRGADAALDTFFQDQNDLLINVQSMTSLETVYPGDLWRAKVVPCHHFAYFSHPESVDQLGRWLAGQ
ncbi:MAG: alpha/beta hydrolase [Anaerolineae bacterium]|nr:alpha/beta hydrolase [Anaerolineae bacterium]